MWYSLSYTSLFVIQLTAYAALSKANKRSYLSGYSNGSSNKSIVYPFFIKKLLSISTVVGELCNLIVTYISVVSILLILQECTL